MAAQAFTLDVRFQAADMNCFLSIACDSNGYTVPLGDDWTGPTIDRFMKIFGPAGRKL